MRPANELLLLPQELERHREGRLLGRTVGPRDWASPEGKALISGLLETPPNW